MRLDRPATAEEVAAIMAAVGQLLADEVVELPTPNLDPWHVAARVESLGIVRRIPGKLDLRYMGAPTRERLTRPLKP
ncbi:MAG: hypothetical protein JWM80_1852 [Cyanobacteria bacterium RYN_339]|nr:hypothetical protein [Cyanobacteria bacterium RYN_339]